jgi:hypothetical protein
VVGEVQKAYNALAGILKREADEAYNAVDALRSGPVTIPKELEWTSFINNDPHFISADTPLRKVENIEYPGKNHPAAAEVRAGMLERKSKYLKSYTPGWWVCVLFMIYVLTCYRYVLSPTHLHEFKSADHIYSQAPVMSLLLSDQKLGSHSQPGSSSHKFMLKGSQTGSMHRGHSWVFRAESYDTMLAWYDDIRALTEKTGEERNAFVRKHARTLSASSHHKASSISGDSALDEDEADEVPFSASELVTNQEGSIEKPKPTRPEPGGRFPSDLNINRHLQAPLSPSSGSSVAEQDITTMAGGLQSTNDPMRHRPEATEANAPIPVAEGAAIVHREPTYFENATAYQQQIPTNPVNDPYVAIAGPETVFRSPAPLNPVAAHPSSQDPFLGDEPGRLARHDSNYADWMRPAATGTAVGTAATLGAEEFWRNKANAAEDRAAIQEVNMADTGKMAVVAEPVVPEPVFAENTVAEPILHTPVTASGRSDTAMSMLSESTAATELFDSPTASKTQHTLYDTNPDGSVNATATGRAFPVLRHNTDTSVSNLHVPGEFPNTSYR